MRSFKGFLLILLAVVGLGNSHLEVGKARDVTCNYYEADGDYFCELTRLKLASEDDVIRFTGKQVKGLTNEDVSFLHIHSSETYFVPSENIFTFFTNLKRLKMPKNGVNQLSLIVNCFPLDYLDLSGNLITALDAGREKNLICSWKCYLRILLFSFH